MLGVFFTFENKTHGGKYISNRTWSKLEGSVITLHVRLLRNRSRKMMKIKTCSELTLGHSRAAAPVIDIPASVR